MHIDAVEFVFGQLLSGTSAPSHVEGFRSALKWLYDEHKATMDDDTTKLLSRMLSGYRRERTSLKRQGMVRQQEGKRPLRFPDYKAFARHLMTMTPCPTSSVGNHR